ncbi:uncharacterized protein N0V89_006400 [Didymosphaeria variabile]|uniref:25S rRNA (uridine-N(3))-methyltransferase BMT5-like domain-containing protein n=1 Tax=Didymosphaeria variabile TaxID=1932322 RepID=A0A9W8XPQ7_9PLEO|nr:uncharacterized protein N0V89_006400 [Didymosphaeria variabile]KAJ4354663.1 hypothetical protein N0V89_006400 [Didymosphaeria variabile]
MATISYLYLGSGDYSAPWELAKQKSVFDQAKAIRCGLDLSQPINPGNEGASRTLQGITITATELLTREATDKLYRDIDKRNGVTHEQHGELDRVQDNIRNIQLIGEARLADVPDTTKVIGGFDATKYPLGTPDYDRIIFDNPHSGVYGSPTDDVQNMRAVTSNQGLLEAVMKEARAHLKPNGFFELSVCGWPFLAKPSRQKEWDTGMDLGREEKVRAFADNLHMRVESARDEGIKSVTRNNGDVFQAQVIRFQFARA